MRDRLRASELLAKASGDFLERVEMSTTEPPEIRVVFEDVEPLCLRSCTPWRKKGTSEGGKWLESVTGILCLSSSHQGGGPLPESPAMQ